MISTTASAKPLQYDGCVVLAPMVRIGTLPSRLLALRFGADIAYSEEMIDFRMLKTKRVENELLHTVDFVMEDGTVALQICPEERGKVVFQLGTSNSRRAVKVAKMVEKDVSGIDVNMGCPKTFSVSGGMGAALLKQPELAKEILSELVKHVNIPVTCKIRCLDTLEDTIAFAKMAESTGIAALALHGRNKEERPKHQCRYSYIKKVAQALTIPVIANGGSGEIKEHSDIEKFRLACGASSVMVARAAEWNVSIFRKEGILSKDQLINEYIKVAIDYDNHWTNTKYCVQQILGSDVQSDEGTQLLASKCPEDIYSVYNMMDYYNDVHARHELYRQTRREIEERGYDDIKGLKVKIVRDEQSRVVSYESNLLYDRKVSEGNQTPKMYLYNYLRRTGELFSSKPSFHMETEEGGRRFRSTMEYGGIKYISNRWHKRKMWAEQAVSQIYMQLNDIGDWTSEGKDLKPSAGGDARSKELRLSFNNESIDVKIDLDSNGKVISYSTSHIFHCNLSKDSSPVDRLCQYLLQKQLEEPEYDMVSSSGDVISSCTLRHSGVEYTVNSCYSNKKAATNAVCQLYLLIHKIPSSTVDDPIITLNSNSTR
ncbi:tRNA-dihydrouridine(20) synthase [NAD(P)+]-like isoform X2 [Watersipora subatra]|uniref:tRNA-dihydrouridine(20) synthase [NAD(P)+]-like isoform X2 n=1 Tax=Watersipora subatra TaxID=2589382 RepID=UPI00355BC82A